MQITAPKKFQEWNEDIARQTISEFITQPGALIEALHRIQDTFGYVSDAAIILLASSFNLSRAEVHGVASFYHDFKRSMPGKHVIKVCQAEACQAMGSDALTDTVKTTLGIDFHATSEDGNFTLEPVYCLGNCACSPNIMVDKQVYARMTADKFSSLMNSMIKEAQS